MEIVLARAIKNVIEKEWGFDAEIIDDYSGRGMFGDTTAAVVVENPYIVFGAVGYLLGYYENEALGVLPSIRSVDLDWLSEELDRFYWESLKVDNMGRKYVVY